LTEEKSLPAVAGWNRGSSLTISGEVHRAQGSFAGCVRRLNEPAQSSYTLLFGELSQRDQCTDAACLNHKMGKFVEQQIAAKPKLVQITTVHRSNVMERR
jgi:hypothetical protein